MKKNISICEQLGVIDYPFRIYDIKDDMGFIIYHEFQLRDDVSYWEYINYSEYGDIKYIETSNGNMDHYE